MLQVKARVHREGPWYVIDVDGYGVTQAESALSTLRMARDLVAMVADVDPGQVAVTFVEGGL